MKRRIWVQCQNNLESRRKYGAIHSSVHSFARTANSFSCAAHSFVSSLVPLTYFRVHGIGDKY